MDLDGFTLKGLQKQKRKTFADTSDVLDYLNEEWYSLMSRRGRMMDLIGDYAGSELFLLDGNSLIQEVLEDSLLAIGRESEPSFQILHAMHSLEQLLENFQRRDAVFEIAFWEGTQDPKWHEYLEFKKPMFVMVNDGSTLHGAEHPFAAEATLLQRFFMLELVCQGVALSLLHGVVFQDSKITTMVMEQRRELETFTALQKKLHGARHSAFELLQSAEIELTRHSVSLSTFRPCDRSEEMLAAVSRFVGGLHIGELSDVAHWPALLFAFVIHLLTLPSLSVEERARPLQRLDSMLECVLTDVFLPRVFLALYQTLSQGSFIDIDGRVFVDVLACILRNPDLTLSEMFGEDIATQAEQIWDERDLPQVDFPALVSQLELLDGSSPTSSNSSLPPFKVLAFSNRVFDDILEPLDIDVADSDVVPQSPHFGFNERFIDAAHWHNHRRAMLPKHLGGEVVKPANAWAQKNQLKRDQNFKKQLQWQAKTLTGAFGAILEPIVITQSQESAAAKNSSASKSHVGKKPKKEHISSAEKIRRANAEKKAADADKSNRAWWSQELTSLKKLTTPQKISRLEALQRNERRAGSGSWLGAMFRLYDVNLQLQLWMEDPDSEHPTKSAAVRDKYLVSIMSKIKTICELGGLWPSAIKLLKAVLGGLGFSSYGQSLLDMSPDQSDSDKKLGFDLVRLDDFMRITEDPVLWQLRVFGEHMDRSMDSQSDPRVSFKPDAWQRRVLDSLDANESVLVVAPTSAGKTFISYYAMEKILRGSDNDILVYIAPTKALVTQIAAEVYGRFTKNFSNSRSCWAIHTRDYRINDPTNCQILITVPEILATLLLSPALARVWTPRIKWIILDEIHTIGQQAGGAVWEQIILLAPCPIIGLSATIGQPEKFNTWLESVQVEHGFQHNFIHHRHRYSHLRKFTFVMQDTVDSSAFPGLHVPARSPGVTFVHPASLLTAGPGMLPSDFSLEARDCLSLYNAVYSLRDTLPIELSALKPTRFFQKTRLLRQQDVLAYEDELKNILIQLMQQSDPRDRASPIMRVVDKLRDNVSENKLVPRQDGFLGNVLYLLAELHCSRDLPALLFQFDRKACEVMAMYLLEALEASEKEWRESSPEWSGKISRWERWRAGEKDRQRQAEKAAKAKKKEGQEDVRSEQATSWEETFNPDDPSPQFSFVGRSTYTKADLEDALRDMSWVSIPQWALDALRRGIAVHHAGMNKAYRSLVESLYRLGFVRVIICTGTLALGINAPTKTSVFCGDSPFLTALMYRQCAGRAGRRGFDLLGKVVFFGLSMDRIQRLVLSRLPSLGGNFPMSSTMVLRLFNLLEGSGYSEFAEGAIRSMLQLPHVSFTSDIGRDQLLHHTRFSIDYLRRAGLLDANGHPIDLFGVAAHLYYTEPSNLALITLLRSGVIHRICNQPSMIDAQYEFMLVMCHLFGRRYLPSAYSDADNVKELIRKSASMVVLPPLPDDARDALLRHDGEILRVFTGYALTYASQAEDDAPGVHRLPITGKEYSKLSDDDTPQAIFRVFLRSSCVQVKARSPFVANSGHDDTFSSVPELTRTARRGLHLNDHAIPSLHRITSLPRDPIVPYHLNAYLLDYFIHGQKQAVINMNGIREGDLWALLEDFTLCLKAIRSSLEKLLLGAEGSDDEDEDTIDPAEAENIAMTSATSQSSSNPVVAGEEDPPRPRGVSDANWRVFLVVHQVTVEFEKKFKAMWA
ncbi:hypothetical protein EIP91_003835 [Steccherinum ochraceum]|uniref:P-loop containing nucleoside triphosphate hydrolase protein n=1 Tax=Steccherinum ochraceum TaxID=92696 RepID=A0A4R0RD57_9APHY|nr:hypothetical protein EIP91_003835 [Steccherinum ochraceum]